MFSHDIRPVYGDESSSESEEDNDLQTAIIKRKEDNKMHIPEMVGSTSSHATHADDDQPIPEEVIKSDRRLQRLMNRVNVTKDHSDDSDDDVRARRNRHIADPQVLAVGTESRRRRDQDSSDDERADGKTGGGDDEDEETVERRHAALRKVKQNPDEEEELLKVEDDHHGSEGSDEDDSDQDEYSDSSEDFMPRLKPVFVAKNERVTVKEREIQEKKEREAEIAAKKEAEERRKSTLKMIEDDIRKEEKEREEEKESEMMQAAIDAVDTSDEADEETSYEFWKVRELKRVKREKDEREALIKQQEETEKLRNMTEEERQEELAQNPKVITNRAEKGDYKFLQKYYHRGAFYLDEEHEVLKRNVAEPTLEDHFNKEVLPKVMQVKNFGLSGRTKYTHLVDQDTSVFDSPWLAETPQTSKFVQSSGGTKPIFERPSKKRKT